MTDPTRFKVVRTIQPEPSGTLSANVRFDAQLTPKLTVQANIDDEFIEILSHPVLARLRNGVLIDSEGNTGVDLMASGQLAVEYGQLQYLATFSEATIDNRPVKLAQLVFDALEDAGEYDLKLAAPLASGGEVYVLPERATVSAAQISEMTAYTRSLVAAEDVGAARALLDSDTYVAYDAVHDGVTDDRAALAAADAAAWAAKKPLLLPSGTYRVGSALSFVSAVVFQPGAILKPDDEVKVLLPGGVVTSGLYRIFDHSAGGKCVPLKAPYYHPAWWGPTGTTNDSQTWKDMLSVSYDFTGSGYQQRILVPAGASRLWEVDVEYATLVGLGRESSWIQAATIATPGDPTTGTGYIIKLAHNSTLQDVTVDTGTAYGAITAVLYTGSLSSVINCYIRPKSVGSVGLWCYIAQPNPAIPASIEPHIINTIIEGNSEESPTGTGLIAESADGQATQVTIINCDIGINFKRASWWIIGSHIWGCNYAVSGAGYFLRFEGCNLGNSKYWGVRFQYGALGCFFDRGTRFYDNGHNVVDPTDGGGLLLDGVTNSGPVADNRVDAIFDSNRGTGMWLRSADRTTGSPLFTSSALFNGTGPAVTEDGILIDDDCNGTELNVSFLPGSCTNLVVNNNASDTSRITFSDVPVYITLSGGTATLASDSSRRQVFYGTGGTVKLPADVCALETWEIDNQGSGDIAVQASDASTIWTVPSGRLGKFTSKIADAAVSSDWATFISGTPSAVGYTTVLRASDGTITAANPTSGGHVTTKDYVDTTRQPKIMTGTVATAGATTAKTVTLDSPWNTATPATGDILLLRFTNGNSATSPTLAVNGGTAYQITTPGGGTGANVGVATNYIALLIFDGTTSRYMLTGATYNSVYATPTYTTAGRPSAAAVAAGTAIFNTTTGIPNWSNGTNWVDATGATV